MKDVNPQINSAASSPTEFVNLNGVAFFLADDGVHGLELWKSDGTEAGTTLVKDILPYDASPSPADLVSANGLVFFRANDGTNGWELWKSDGTEAGTIIVKDIRPGGSAVSTSVKPAVMGNQVFFRATDGTNGEELWKSDGTAAGTVMVKDIVPGSGGALPNKLTPLGDRLYFEASVSPNGYELWKTDGNEAGTMLVKDINPGSGSSSVTALTPMNGMLFFRANDGTNGTELWKSDGTEAGTVLVTNLAPGSASSAIEQLTAVNGTLFFRVSNQLWKSDGTETGAVVVTTISAGATRFTAINGLLYFTDSNSGNKLYKSDGTAAGTLQVLDSTMCAITSGRDARMTPFEYNGTACFLSWCILYGLAMTDGTPAGSVNIKPFTPGNLPVNIGGTLFFQADDGVRGYELWRSDGTSNGTFMVKDIRAATQPATPIGNLTDVNGTLFFSAKDGLHGEELWRSDGTADGTRLVMDIYPGGLGDSRPSQFVNWNGTVFLSAMDGNQFSQGDTGPELWRSDGTTNGTVLVKDIHPGASGSFAIGSAPSDLVVFSNLLVFAASGTNGAELWRSDGTEAGTALVKDILLGNGGSSPKGLMVAGGHVYFSASDGTNGTELWRSDGTEAGTEQVADVHLGTNSSSPAKFTWANDALLFTANNGTNGLELWRSDGTGAGTWLVKDIRPGGNGALNGSPDERLIEINGTVFFTADDGTNGRELWRSDGTSNGTVRVKDIYPGSNGGVASQTFAELEGTLFFAANNGASGVELWKSDGTSNGTVQVADILPAGESAYPRYLIAFNGRLFFSADDEVRGRELWTSDGTAEGTFLLADIIEGPVGSDPQNFCVSGGTLFFTANRADIGVELFALFREDFGDAPTNYPTLLTDDGARHVIPTGGARLFLGLIAPDGGLDAHPDAAATGDDLHDTADEDGVTLPVYLNSGQTQALAMVVAGDGGRLNAWVDWNADGDWSGAGERVFTDAAPAAGTNTLSLVVPTLSVSGPSFARFRLSSADSLLPTGAAPDGEVEDYQVILNLPPSIAGVSAANVGQPGAWLTSYVFSITYDDDHGIVVSSLDAGDVTVTGPGGPLIVISAAEPSGSDGSPRTATYTVIPPGGSWNDADNGTYTVGVIDEEVADVGGLRVPANTRVATFTVNMDTTPPDSVITGYPPAQTNSASAVFTFIADDGPGTGVAGYEFSLDGSAFAPVTSPKTVTSLSDGPHTFQVRAADLVGNVETNPASRTWTVDTTPPETTITLQPPLQTNATSASFAFTGDDGSGTGVASFEMSLDGGPFAPAVSPVTLTGLGDGWHSFEVRARDAVSNSDPTPARHTWLVDTTPPATTITSQPPPFTNATVARFMFSGDDGGGSGVAGFEAALDGAAFTPAVSPVTLSNLSDGPHTFRVRATDLLGNLEASPASSTWTVDTVPPDTTITTQPANPTNATSATFAFTGDDGSGSGVSGFEVSLDSAAFVTATSPHTVSGLAEGAHTFQARALDTAGSADPTPASFTWMVDLTPPAVSIGPPSATVATLGESVYFTVTFGGADAVNLNAGHVTLETAATATAAVSVTGAGLTERIVTLADLTGAGTLGISLAAGSAGDLAGNQAPAAGPSVVFQLIEPPPTKLDVRQSEGTFVLSFNGLSNRAYRIQFAPALTLDPQWQVLGTAVVNHAGFGAFTSAPAAETRFFRTVFP